MIDSASTPLTAIAAWNDLGGGPTVSGEIVGERTAMAISTVYTCVTILAESIASLPCKLMKRTEAGSIAHIESDLYDLLAYAPNPEMTSFTFWSTMVGSSALAGNGYAQIVRDASGAPESIWPLHPLKTEPIRQQDGTLAYKTTDGMKEGTYRIIAAKDVLHFPLFSLDGIKGVSPVKAARESFAMAMAMERYGARWFANGAQPSGLLIYKGAKPDPKVQAELKESWQAAHSGSNQHRQGFLFGDWTYQSIGMSPEDSQFLVARNYQRADIAAMYKLPPHMVGSLERLSNNNYVQQQLSFVIDTLRPILVRIEQELQRKLLPNVGRNAGKLYVEFDVSERLRGDWATQIRTCAVARQWSILTANECREELGYSPVGPEGDVLLYPINMGNSEQLLDDPNLIPATQMPANDPKEDPNANTQ
jgi:HK97 family phage portal protein